MAAAVVTVVVEDILQTLEEGMKLGKKWGIESELREIHQLWSSILGVLTEAENKYGRNFELQEWVGRLKQATFDAECLLEELSTEDALWQRKRMVRRLFRPLVKLTFRWRMRDELRNVARRMKDLITSDWISFVRNIPAEIVEALQEAHTVPFIGRDDEKGELRRLLLFGGMARVLCVISVNTYRGIGKTALVREVCLELKLNGHFDDIIWVNASLPFDENRMARDIFASLTKGDATSEENVVKEQLLMCVWKLLDRKKKYLFILDNSLVHYSDRRRWVRFCSFLEGGANGSKILVTTRDHEEIPYQHSPTFHLKKLTLGDSRDLLLKTAFMGRVEEIIDPVKLKIIEEIAEKCLGNPLIIRAWGGYETFVAYGQGTKYNFESRQNHCR